ncbi:hypothetical protein FB451DRAFT_1175121 [Mycena latifolia]|nr:hypothetical protein FB451DRAFT_1175121 [Mycena latifolia]
MNEASDRVSDAEAARPMLEVYCSESAKTTSLLYLLAAQPQFCRNRVKCGPPEELDTRNRCRMKGKTKFRSKEWLPQALQARPQVRQGCPQVQLGSTNEQNAQICNVGSESGLNARGDCVRCQILGCIMVKDHAVLEFLGWSVLPGMEAVRVMVGEAVADVAAVGDGVQIRIPDFQIGQLVSSSLTTESTVQNNLDGTQTLTIRDPNTKKRCTMPTHARGTFSTLTQPKRTSSLKKATVEEVPDEDDHKGRTKKSKPVETSMEDFQRYSMN